MRQERWNPHKEISQQEARIMKRLGRVRKLLGFLRRHRSELFDDACQDELEGMYRTTGAGKDAKPPALMAIAVLVQGYLQVSDAEMVELTVVDLRVQMVLNRLGERRPAFSQGALCAFRERLIRHDMDRRLLERTVELARRTGEFDWRKVPRTVRIGVDACPLGGAGRVEDTINLLAHAGRNVVDCAAGLLGWSREQVCEAAGTPLLAASSAKTGLDLNWNDEEQKAGAIKTLIRDLDALQEWIVRSLPGEVGQPPLKEQVETLEQIRRQDLEPDPAGGGLRIRKGVAPDRRISIEDKEMRHGRKSKNRRYNGFSRHLASDLNTDLIYATAILPANRPEGEATAALEEDLNRLEIPIDELYIDRAYINSSLAGSVQSGGGQVFCKPWAMRNGERFPKSAFDINVRDRIVTCPQGHAELFAFGTVVEFDPEHCDHCPVRKDCTSAEEGHGRTLSIAEDERLQKRLRKLQDSKSGRRQLRRRTGVEHALAHASRRQGRRARYKGVRKNNFDLRRTAAIQNLETLQRATECDRTPSGAYVVRAA